jgi:hypothetical protein
MVADVFDEFGGYDTSSNYIMEISSGGQPSPIDASQSTAHKILAGYVYSAGWPGIVVTSPNGGECLDTGSNYDITWMSFGLTKNVKIDYSLDGGSSWHSVASNTANDGIENWHISNDTSSICLVRICDVDSNFCDMSDDYFSIHTECPVPVLTNYGIIVLLILLTGTAVWMLKRKRLATQRNN